MNNIFITNILIHSVRHLKDIEIPLSNIENKNLIITGKNGSGKTSVLNEMSTYLETVVTDKNNKFILDDAHIKNGLDLTFNVELSEVFRKFNEGKFILAYYSVDRIFKTEEVKNVEKINLNTKYFLNEKPSAKFVKYLVDLKVTQALALTGNRKEKAEQIDCWFQSLEKLLKVIFNEDSLKLVFDEDYFKFNICIDNRNPFDFNTLSSGYAAILDIVVDLIMRMEKNSNRKFDYQMPGIVLIDEIETHLHLEMQKNILLLLTTIFPNIQFVVSTHSPFVLNSIENVIIYDLE